MMGIFECGVSPLCPPCSSVAFILYGMCFGSEPEAQPGRSGTYPMLHIITWEWIRCRRDRTRRDAMRYTHVRTVPARAAHGIPRQISPNRGRIPGLKTKSHCITSMDLGRVFLVDVADKGMCDDNHDALVCVLGRGGSCY